MSSICVLCEKMSARWPSARSCGSSVASSLSLAESKSTRAGSVSLRSAPISAHSWCSRKSELAASSARTWRDMGRCGEMWRDVGRCGEMW